MYLLLTEDLEVVQIKNITEELLEEVILGVVSVFSKEGDEFIELLPSGQWSVVEYGDD